MTSLWAILPVIVLALWACVLLLVDLWLPKDQQGSQQGESNSPITPLLAALGMLTSAAIVIARIGQPTMGFGGMMMADGFSHFICLLLLASGLVTIGLSHDYMKRLGIARGEYYVLLMFSLSGMMLMSMSADLIMVFLSLELLSIPLYVMAGIATPRPSSEEAALKYFLLGAFASGFLVYGIGLVFGATGSTSLQQIVAVVQSGNYNLALILGGAALIITGLGFKVAIVPFHMWTPDVYEGAPTSVTAFFAIVPKMASLALMVRVFMGPFEPMVDEWRQVVVLLAVASMALGSVAAIAQQNIKRMLAYSSIGHMGYALGGIAAASEVGIKAVIIYATIYMLTSIGTFAIVMMMKQKDRMVENIRDLSGLASRQPMIALSMAIMMFSMAGIPPLAGFFSKLFIFQAAIDAGLYGLVIMGVLTSVISAFYYLRIIKIMYFDAAPDEGIDPATDGRLNAVLAVSSATVVLFIAMPAPLLGAAGAAAATLFSR